MPDDRRIGKSKDEEGRSLSSSIENFSKSMIKNSGELKSNTKKLSKNSTSLDKNTAALSAMVASFNKSVNQMGKTLDDFINDQAKDTERRRKDQEDGNKQRKADDEDNAKRIYSAGEAFVESFKVVGRRLVKEYLGGAQRIITAYKNSFSDITVRMQWTESDYASMFNSIRNTIMQDGFGQQFSAKDYTTALTEVLSTGLRGDEAQRLAYQNMITNKLIPAISTNTTAYRRMSKEFGEAFNQNITAMAKYTEAVYGAEGIEEGKLNNLVSEVYREFTYQTAKQGLSQEETDERWANIQGTVSAMYTKYGESTAEGFLSNLKDGLNGSVEGSSLLQNLTGTTLASQSGNSLMSIQDYAQRYLSTIESFSDNANVFTNVPGLGDTSTYYEVGAKKYQGYSSEDFSSELGQFLEGYNKSAVYQNNLDWLKAGGGKTADERLDTYEENIATSVGVIGAQIPRLSEIREDLKKIKEILIGSSLFKMFKGSSSSGKISNVLYNKLLGTSGETFQSLYSAGSQFPGLVNGSSTFLGSTKLGSVNAGLQNAWGTVGGSGFGGASTALGTMTNLAAGPGALLAGAYMMGKDAIGAGGKFADEGYSTGTVIAQGAKASITGHASMTDKEQSDAVSAALQGQKQSFNWGELGSNTLKGTAIGAGVGTAVGGWAAGLGTIIGGGIGAVTGALTNAIDQMVENAKYNKLADSVNKFNEGLSEAQTSLSKYQAVVQKSEDTYQALDIITGKVTATESERQSVLKSLKEQYPALLHNVEDLSDFDEEYVEVIKRKLEIEKKVAASTAITDTGKLVDELDELTKNSDNLTQGVSIGKQSADFLNEIISGDEGSSYANALAKVGENGEGLKKIASKYAEKAGVSTEDFLNKLSSKGILKKTGGGYSLDEIHTVWANIEDDYNLKDDKLKGIKKGQEKQYTSYQETLNNASNKIYEVVLNFDKLYESSVKDDGQVDLSESQLDLLTSYTDKLKSAVENYNKMALQLDGTPYHSDDSLFDVVHKLYTAAGKTLTPFKLGAYDIQSDQLAQLHSGEMVLTSANAEKLRQIGSGGISGVLDQMVALSDGVTTSTVQSDDSHQESLFTTVVSAIETQTTELVKYLIEINNTIMRIVSQNGSTGATEITAATVTYEGR